MKILVIEPQKIPYEKEISGSLESMQAIVGGTIQAIYPYDDPVALVCNDEGKLINLPLNRVIEDYDIIAGTFFICGLGVDDFESLSSSLMQKYATLFHTPQMFIRSGSKILALPCFPGKE